MLGSSALLFKPVHAQHGHSALLKARASGVSAAHLRPKASCPSTNVLASFQRPLRASNTIHGRAICHFSAQSMIQRRNVSSDAEKNQAERRSQRIADDMLREEKRMKHHHQRLSLDSFFDEDQKVGESRVYNKPASHFEDEEDELLSATPVEDKKQSIAFGLDTDDNLDNFDSNSGLSSFRPQRKAAFRSTRTVALEKLEQSGMEFAPEDMIGMDYESLVRTLNGL